MQINSPDVPDLTVVDLPGTTTIPMKNQPQSIVADLENMALHYISDPNSIILAVTPANADVANSQALQLAGRVDPGVGGLLQQCACSAVRRGGGFDTSVPVLSPATSNRSPQAPFGAAF